MSDERISGSLGERLSNIISGSTETGWRVIHAGIEGGPFSESELIEKAVAGELGADDLVKQATGLWSKAPDVAFLKNEFRLKEAKQQTLDELGRFNGIWVSKRALAIGGGILVLLVIAAGVWILRAPDDKRVAHAKQPDVAKKPDEQQPREKNQPKAPLDLAKQNEPAIDPRSKLTDEDNVLINLGIDVALAPYSNKPLAGIGKSLFVSVLISPDARDVLSVAEVKTRVELRLRQSGFTVTPDASVFLVVGVDGLWQNPPNKISMTDNIELRVNVPVLVKQPNGAHVRMNGTIWSDGYIGVAGKATLPQHLEGGIDKTLDRFLNEYLAGNPK